jgi:predicted permease
MGYFFKHIKFPDESFWKHLDKFNYFVLFPALLFYKISSSDIKNIVSFDFIITSSIALVVVSFLVIVINKILKFENSSFTSIYQGAIRFNVYVFLSLTDALLTPEGFVLGLLLMTFIIPFINILCISIFTIYVPRNKITIVSFLKSIITNPLIVACLLGGIFSVFGWSFPIVIDNTLSILTSAALPLGLLSVGVGLHISTFKESKMSVAVSTVAKLLVFPAVMYGVCLLIGVEKETMILLILFASMPTASSAYVLAMQLGGDLKLISSIISIQVILSIFTISIFIWLLNIN